MRPTPICIATTVLLSIPIISPINAFAPAKQFTNRNALCNNNVGLQQRPTLPFQKPTPTPNTQTANMIIDPSQFTTETQSLLTSTLSSTTNFLSFADQGQNLAGIFFQASLLPYLAFLYFLSFRGNRTPALGNFGFQYLLLFVFGTIPSGIISKLTYSQTLANVDWLHGGAEVLLCVTNILIVVGWRDAMTNGASQAKKDKGIWKPKAVALGCGVAFAAACAVGPSLGFEAHSAFLLGAGDLSDDFRNALPWVVHTEPENALSIPTWAIHSSSVIEYLIAMDIIWNYAENTGNEKWKGLTWGMLPNHASGICACTYHFFYNPSSFQFIVTTQAGLTLLGNITLAIAAYRIAISNGWEPRELNPFPGSSTSSKGIVVDNIAVTPLVLTQAKESDAALALKLAVLTIGTAYIVKYGELGLELPFTPNGAAAIAIVSGIPALTAYNFYTKGQGGQGLQITSFELPSFGSGGDGDDKPQFSMDDVKKFGVAGTVAYVLTELAFWAVAFPVASTALYQSTGHWPDVVNDVTDRATVLGFIFAGANVARLAVPLRFGAALALAPWVDENIINRGGAAEE